MKRLTLKDAKACPFCGGKDFETFDIGGESYLTIRCNGCEAEGPQEDHDDEALIHSAVQRWNRRAAMSGTR